MPRRFNYYNQYSPTHIKTVELIYQVHLPRQIFRNSLMPSMIKLLGNINRSIPINASITCSQSMNKDYRKFQMSEREIHRFIYQAK